MILVDLPPGSPVFRAHTPAVGQPTHQRCGRGDSVLAHGYTGILYPSLANAGGTNVVVYSGRLTDGNSITVNDPEGQLPRDQSSWDSANEPGARQHPADGARPTAPGIRRARVQGAGLTG